MVDHSLPTPNTQALSWFYGESKKGTLRLDPKYQRNPIWSIGQKCFLIDSLISGAPIPQVFINIKAEGTGKLRKTIYEVVDGQQRLRAILEFMNDEWALVATTAKSYPVSEIYKPQIGRTYSELPASLQDMIWNYQLAVQELRNWADDQIRAIFRRLNYVVEKLNKQELRHSQYFGEFVNAVEELAKDEFWEEIDLFTRRDFQRMKDVEFVSELLVVVIDGIQDGQSTLDRFYAEYDVVFPNKSSVLGKYRQIIDSLRSLRPFLEQSRFSRKKADFYSLFVAAKNINSNTKRPVNLSGGIPALRQLDTMLSKDPSQLTGTAARYYAALIEGSNKRSKREERAEILEERLN